MGEFERNQQVAERICEDLRWGSQSFQVGQCVALLDGRVVAVAEDLGGALRGLRAIEPDPGRGMVLEVGPPCVDVVRGAGAGDAAMLGEPAGGERRRCWQVRRRRYTTQPRVAQRTLG